MLAPGGFSILPINFARMRNVLRTVLWVLAIGLGIFGALLMSGALEGSGSDAAGRGMAQGFGFIICLVAGAVVVALLLAFRWRAWLWVAGAILLLPFVFVLVTEIVSSLNQAHQERETAQMRSGRADFGNQPALLAVAEAISKNDQVAIRSAAKSVPDLQAAGRDGKTLLYFAVDETLERTQLADAVETLLSLGANPNFANEHEASFAMAHSIYGPVRLLRIMLDAGGNPNARDPEGWPMIFRNWQTTYFESDQRARFQLLLDRGADINATLPDDASGYGGYTLAMYRASMGRGDGAGYVDALELLKRGADFHQAAKDGTTLVSLLQEHHRALDNQSAEVAQAYQALVDWLKAHGVASDGL